MAFISRFSWRISAFVTLAIALLFAVSSMTSVFARGTAATLVQLSTDPYTNTSSQHQTEVEPDNYSSGSTIVAATQAGRFFDGGSSNTGWATSTNNGASWTHGFLPGTTIYATPAGPFARVSDPAVAYDAAHNTWLISSLAIGIISGNPVGVAVIVNQSTDGGLTWKNPVTVKSIGRGSFFDKDWIVCDDTSSSNFYGHCYVEWDDANNNNLILMSTSTDGGKTWGPALSPANKAAGIGGQPLVQPNGTVIVPIQSLAGPLVAFNSNNGGTNWSSTVGVAAITSHNEGGNLRSSPLPSAEIDGSGKVYVVWQDCRFEKSCSANDIVMSTSTDGITWTAVQRIPADAVGSGVDHFIPGIGVDKSTSGSSAHLALTYYYYPVSNCSSNCQLDIGYLSSTSGGSTWSAKTQIAGPMSLSWLANTSGGPMVGDYISTTIIAGKAYPVFAVATPPSGGHFHESLDTVSGGLAMPGGHHASHDPVTTTSDQPKASIHLSAF